MIQITPHMQIFLSVAPVDFRKGIDGLVALCRRQFQMDPFGGTLFVFCNKSRKALRILCYDGQGFWLCHKRLSRGRFAWDFQRNDRKAVVRSLVALQLQELIWNRYPVSAAPDEFCRIPKNKLALT
jgi:transposase